MLQVAFPLLSLLIWLPIAGGVALFLLGGGRASTIGSYAGVSDLYRLFGIVLSTLGWV